MCVNICSRVWIFIYLCGRFIHESIHTHPHRQTHFHFFHSFLWIAIIVAIAFVSVGVRECVWVLMRCAVHMQQQQQLRGQRSNTKCEEERMKKGILCSYFVWWNVCKFDNNVLRMRTMRTIYINWKRKENVFLDGRYTYSSMPILPFRFGILFSNIIFFSCTICCVG